MLAAIASMFVIMTWPLAAIKITLVMLVTSTKQTRAASLTQASPLYAKPSSMESVFVGKTLEIRSCLPRDLTSTKSALKTICLAQRRLMQSRLFATRKMPYAAKFAQ